MSNDTERDARLRLYAELGDSRQYLGPQEDEIGAREAMRADVASLLKERDALQADYAAAVRALRAAEWGSLEMNESSEAVGESCPVCHRLEDHRRSYGEYLDGHAPGCSLWAVLSSPRAVQVLKEVE